MKRWTIRISLLLILGVVTTVAVAWGLACTVSMEYPQEVDRGLEVIERGPWEIYSWHGFGSNRVDSYLFDKPIGEADSSASDVLPTWCAAEIRASLPVRRYFPSDCPEYIARGWPCLVLWHRQEINTNVRVVEGATVLGLGDDEYGNPRALPLRPILPGFIINTLFYAAIWFVLFFSLRFAKRTVRKSRGRCVECRYDLRGGLVRGCPECGWNRE